jgi:hypothetical protein
MSARMLIGLLAVLALGGCAPLVVHPQAHGGGFCAGVYERRCLPGEFCDIPAGQCHGFQVAGICVPQSEICPRDYRPVCACNGTTYGNDCMRIADGAQKAHDGECTGDATRPCPHAKKSCPRAMHGCPHAKKDCPHKMHSCPHERQH